jgi:hypothetical protein
VTRLSWRKIIRRAWTDYLQTLDRCFSLSSSSQYLLQFLPPAFWQATKHFSDEQPQVSADAVRVVGGLIMMTKAVTIADTILSIFPNPLFDQPPQ